MAIVRPLVSRPSPHFSLTNPSPRSASLLAMIAGSLLAGQPAPGQPPAPTPAPAPGAAPPPAIERLPSAIPALDPFENRVIREVRMQGLKAVDEQLLRNQLRSQQGRPLKQATVQTDVQNFTRLGKFKEITARVQPFEDSTVLLIFEFLETPIIRDVQVTGNRQISDQELRSEVTLLANTPVDRFQLDRTQRRIEDLYRKKGYYQAAVTVEQKELDENGIVLFRIREGDRVKITDIRFDGNASQPARLLRSQIKTEEAGILTSGTLDDTVLDQDVSNLIKFYRDRGYLDVRADRTIRPAPNGREAILTFLVEEGALYTLRSIRVTATPAKGEPGPGAGGKERPLTVMSQEQLAGLLPIKVGDAYSVDKVGKAVEIVRNAYGQMGFVDVSVARAELRDPASPQVDLLLTIREGKPSKTGLVAISGNDLTQDKVIRRQVQVQPERPLDSTAVKDTEALLTFTNLFAGPRERRPEPRATIQPADDENPGHRDVLIEVEEKNTGAVTFGAAVTSDAGLLGQISLSQRNFDIADVPESFSEFITGRAFRGAGQTFNIAVQPGTESSNYSVSFAEPSLLGTEYTFGVAGYFRQRDFTQYDDDRFGGRLNFGRQFGQRWQGEVFMRAESIDINNIDANSATDIFDVEGRSTLTGFGARLVRNTLDSRLRPSKGTRLELSVERVGAFGGDYDFTKIAGEHQLFLTVGEDFLGRKQILQFKTLAQYIPEGRGEAPIFERYFLGGRSFRGYRFRGVSPRGVRRNPVVGQPDIPSADPVGGTWAFFFGPEFEQPLIEKTISGVVFIDSGTVSNDVSFGEYRAAFGAGIRLYLPQLGPAPLAFDFAFPFLKQEEDGERVFSFAVDIPF